MILSLNQESFKNKPRRRNCATAKTLPKAKNLQKLDLGREAATASAGAGGVGVLEDEALAHHFVLEVDFDAIEVEVGLHVDEDFDAMAIELFVHFALGLFGEVEHVRETRAAAALDANAELGLAFRQALVLARL